MPKFDSDFQSKPILDIDAGRLFLFNTNKLQSCWAMKLARAAAYDSKSRDNGQVLLFQPYSESGPALTVITDEGNSGLWINSAHAVKPVLRPNNFEFGKKSNGLTSLVIHGPRMYFRAKMMNEDAFVLVDCLSGSLKQDMETTQATIEVQEWSLVTEAGSNLDKILFSTIQHRTPSGNLG